MASLVVSGDTSGAITIAAPAVAGTNTLTLPASTGTLVVTGGAQTIEFADGSASAPSITNSGDTNTGIFFPAADTIAFSEGGTESMRIDSSGNVGIGTNSPSTPLNIVRNAAGAQKVLFSNNSSGSSAETAFSVSNGTAEASLRVAGGSYGGYGAYTANNTLVYNDTSAITIMADNASNGIIKFATGGNTERMRIDSSGNVGIGTTTMTGVFNVTGGGNGTYLTQSTGAGYVLQTDAQSNAGTYYFVNFLKAGVGISNITSNGTTITYGTGSDYRLKENIKPMTGGLNKVMQLKPSTWNWQSFFGEGSSQGFVAHELQEIIPEAVTGKKDDVDEDGKSRYQNVDTSFIVATLTAAIQEQQQIITDLKARIETLEGAK